MVVAVVVTAFLGVAVVIVVRALKSSVYCLVVVGLVLLLVVVVGKSRANTATTNATNKAMKHINK